MKRFPKMSKSHLAKLRDEFNASYPQGSSILVMRDGREVPTLVSRQAEMVMEGGGDKGRKVCTGVVVQLSAFDSTLDIRSLEGVRVDDRYAEISKRIGIELLQLVDRCFEDFDRDGTTVQGCLDGIATSLVMMTDGFLGTRAEDDVAYRTSRSIVKYIVRSLKKARNIREPKLPKESPVPQGK